MKVRYYGHVGQTTGYGRAAADNCMALLATGQVELEIRPLGKPPRDEMIDALSGPRHVLGRHIRADHELTDPDVVIVHTLPLDCKRVHGVVVASGPTINETLAAKPWVAYTTWEALTPIPEDLGIGLSLFDQVWCPSSKHHYSPSDTAVYVIPHAFDPESLSPRRTVRLERPEDRFRFYAMGAWSSRKNPAGVLRAWARAFGPDDPVELVMHCPGATEQLVTAVYQTGCHDQMAPVIHSTKHREEAYVWGLHASSDVYVTASRGEAWNLPAFDAMLAGRHIIAPTPQGSDEFLEGTSASRYDGFSLPAMVDVAITDRANGAISLAVNGAQGLSARADWLEPNISMLAFLMQQAFIDRRRELDVTYDPIERFGYEAVGKLALAALEDL
jgi:glycosyltransferase involved in cell wall biosynthesis